MPDPIPDSPEVPTDSVPSSVRFAALLREMGISHVVTLPDNTSAPLLEALEVARTIEEGPSGTALSGAGRGGGGPAEPIRTVLVTREGEAMALASGLWLGGGNPVVLIQNTGLLEAGDGLRGTASRMGAPLLLLVTCRGFGKARVVGVDLDVPDVERDLLVRNDLDSVAHMTMSTLRAWGIPYLVLDDAENLAPLREGWERAHARERPVAVLLDTDFT